jgi:hypothetical protein
MPVTKAEPLSLDHGISHKLNVVDPATPEARTLLRDRKNARRLLEALNTSGEAN